MMVSNRNLLFQGSIFRGYVSFREGTFLTPTVGIFQPVIRSNFVWASGNGIRGKAGEKGDHVSSEKKGYPGYV